MFASDALNFLNVERIGARVGLSTPTVRDSIRATVAQQRAGLKRKHMESQPNDARSSCIHHWDLGPPIDGIVHGKCKLCPAEKDFPAYGDAQIDPGGRHRKELIGKNTKEELDARRVEIVDAWRRNDRNVSAAARELGLHYSTIRASLLRWNFTLSSSRRQERSHNRGGRHESKRALEYQVRV